MSVSHAHLLAATFSVGIMLAASSSGYAQDNVRAEGAKACGQTLIACASTFSNRAT